MLQFITVENAEYLSLVSVLVNIFFQFVQTLERFPIRCVIYKYKALQKKKDILLSVIQELHD